MTVRFNASIIGELRKLVVAHNARITAPELKMRIGPMKGLYKKFSLGPHPHETALAKIEEYLTARREQALNKAHEPFDMGRHPRGRGGKFRSTGRPPARRDDPLLEAVQTQVIPETRFTVLGPPIAGAAGVVLGAASGAAATLPGGPVDHLTTRVLRRGGAKLGSFVGQAAGLAAVTIPRDTVRATVAAGNRRFRTRIPRPSATAGDRAVAALEVGGRRIGGAAGRAAGRVSALSTNWLPAVARRIVGTAAGGGAKGKILGSIVGGGIGAVFPGALIYAPALSHAQTAIGPYEDVFFPRRVKKLAGALFSAPEVLAKQAEILGDDILMKASLAGIGRALTSTARRGYTRLRAAARGTRPISGAAGNADQAAAQTTFTAHGEHATQGFRQHGAPGARALIAGRHVAALAAGGTGVGALAGLGIAHFNEAHPRDRRGRFSRKAEAALQGSRVGAIAGASLGLVTGLIAARRGHGEFLAAGLARLRGEVEAGGHNLPEKMAEEAARTARVAHAEEYRTNNARIIPEFTGTGREPEHVAESLRAHAISTWMRNEGQAIQAGPRAWYNFQLDRGFDRQASQQLRRLGPLTGKDGKSLRVGATNLVNNVDVEKLNPGQRKIWDDLMARREHTRNEIGQVYEARAADTAAIATETTDLGAEKTRLETALKGRSGRIGVPDRWGDIRDEPETTIAHIRAFAKEHLGHDIVARSKAGAQTEVDARLNVWEAETHARLAQIEERLASGEHEKLLNAARNHQQEDLLGQEIGAIPNPFATGRDRLFRNRPAGSNTTAGFNKVRDQVGEAAAEPFMVQSLAHAAAAKDHLNTLIAARESALQAGIPRANAAQRLFAHVAPVLSGRLKLAAHDAAMMSGASRATMTGTQRVIADLIHENQDPARAWLTLKGLAGKANGHRRHLTGKLWENWKGITSVIGPLTALGAIDLSQPFGSNIKVDPRKWKRPRNMAVITEWPDPIRRPHEALVGVSYLTPDGQTRFLSGSYIHGENGEHTPLPFGTDVNRVRETLRNMGGSGGGGQRVDPVRVPNAKEFDDTIEALKAHINPVGPAGFEFEQRTGGAAEKQQREYQDAFWAQHLRHMEQNPKDFKGRSNRFMRYWQSLQGLFEDKRGAILDNAARARLLVGTHVAPPNGRRGVFAADEAVYKAPAAADKRAVTDALIAQMKIYAAGNPENYTQMKRALWTVAEYYGLNTEQRAHIDTNLDTLYINAGNPSVPGRAPQVGPAHVDETLDQLAGLPQARALSRELLTRVPSHQRPGVMREDAKFLEAVTSNYLNHRRIKRLEIPNISDAALHTHAETAVREWLYEHTGVHEIRKSETSGQLGKIDPGMPRSKSGVPAFRPPGIPSIAGAARPAAMAPSISGAATPPAAGAVHPGVPTAPSLGHQVRQAARPAHGLSQLGIYGLSGAAYEGAAALASRLLPGASRGMKLTRFGVSALAGVKGGLIGGAAGRATGRTLGDKSRERRQSTGEQLARGAGGVIGQLGGAAAAGAAAGSLFGPPGAVAGAAIGIAGGAIGGYLTDEGAGILYRHLQRYGAHVPGKIMGSHAARGMAHA